MRACADLADECAGGHLDIASRLVTKLAQLRRFGLAGRDGVLGPPPSGTRGR